MEREEHDQGAPPPEPGDEDQRPDAEAPAGDAEAADDHAEEDQGEGEPGGSGFIEE